MMQQMFLGYGGLPPESYEYFYNGSTSTSMTIPGNVSFFKVAGVAAGSPGSNGPNSHTAGVPGGGGGGGADTLSVAKTDLTFLQVLTDCPLSVKL